MTEHCLQTSLDLVCSKLYFHTLAVLCCLDHLAEKLSAEEMISFNLLCVGV